MGSRHLGPRVAQGAQPRPADLPPCPQAGEVRCLCPCQDGRAAGSGPEPEAAGHPWPRVPPAAPAQAARQAPVPAEGPHRVSGAGDGEAGPLGDTSLGIPATPTGLVIPWPGQRTRPLGRGAYASWQEVQGGGQPRARHWPSLPLASGWWCKSGCGQCWHPGGPGLVLGLRAGWGTRVGPSGWSEPAWVLGLHLIPRSPSPGQLCCACCDSMISLPRSEKQRWISALCPSTAQEDKEVTSEGEGSIPLPLLSLFSPSRGRGMGADSLV